MQMLCEGFQSIVEKSPDAISLLNQRGEILYGSASHSRLFGYQPDELVGRDYIELIHPEDRNHSAFLMQEVINKPPGPSSWDTRVRRKDGNYCWVESTVSNLMNDQQVQAIVLHQRDIHERMEARANALRQAEELTRSNLRMEEFAYTIAHDMREPLRAMSLCMQLLFAKLQLDPESQKLAEFVVDGAGRLSALVTDLLSFARTGIEAPPEPVDLSRAVAQALKNLLFEIRECGASVSVDELPTVLSDEANLVRLFQNLISNALKYRSEKPVIVHVSAKHEGTAWIIKVEDNGVGIAQEYHSRIFLPFTRLAKRTVAGTGLGLAVCKKIMDGFGGSIWVESEPGVGSTFAFTLDDGISELESKTHPVKVAETYAR